MVAAFILFLTASLTVNSIEIAGNRTISTRAIKAALVSRAREEFHATNIRYDVERILQLYRRQGFFSTTVTPEVKTSPTQTDIKYVIVENDRPRIARLEVIGAEPLCPPRNLFMIRQGDFFIEERIRKTTQNLEYFLKDLGYAFANVTTEKEPDSGVLRIDLAKGTRYRVRQVSVSGLRRCRPEIVLREIDIRTGDYYSRAKIASSQRRIYALGFFGAVDVAIITQPGDSLDILLTIKELKSRVFNFGAGVTIPLSFLLSVGVEEMNMFNLGHRFNIDPSLRITLEKEIDTELDLQYVLPYVLPLRLTPSLLPFYRFENHSEYQRRTVGSEIRLTRAFTDDIQAQVAHQYKHVAFQPKVELPDTFRGVTNGIRFQTMFDFRSEFFDPKRGWYLVPVLEYAGGLFSGENNFTRTEAELRAFVPVLGHTVACRIKAGRIFPQGALRSDETYHLGGQYSVRGYEERSIGPDTMIDEHYGLILTNVNLELRVRLPAKFGMVLFADAGYLDDHLYEFRPVSFGLSAGLGLRYHTPIGPLRGDIGFPLRQEGQSGGAYQIYLGLYHIF